ncbi:MAG: hypothetical protein HOV68_07110, partial [Streptomycetaceae bacterium]|nr:hypothetical protein [Streptomycetaceae bacterium]
MRGLLALVGVDPLDPEEITTVPGAADALALRVLARHVAAGRSGDAAADEAADGDASSDGLLGADESSVGASSADPPVPPPRGSSSGAAEPPWDVIVVDLPPVDRAALALALPESLARYLDRLLPVERQAARALRPMLAVVAGLPMPDEWLYATARRVIAELHAIRSLLEAPATSVRLVTRAGAVAAATDRRAASALALYRRTVDDVLVNAVPHGGALPAERAVSL